MRKLVRLSAVDLPLRILAFDTVPHGSLTDEERDFTCMWLGWMLCVCALLQREVCANHVKYEHDFVRLLIRLSTTLSRVA
jgi:hypothetical protein